MGQSANKKGRGLASPSDKLDLQRQFPTAIVANALILIQCNLLVAAAKNAAGLMLPQNDGIALRINFQGIAAGHVQSLAQLDGQSDAAQIINMTNDAGRFHKSFPPKVRFNLVIPILPVFTRFVNWKSAQLFSTI